MGPVVATSFCISVARFRVARPFYIVVALVLFFFGAWFDSLLFHLGVRALCVCVCVGGGGGGERGVPLTLLRVASSETSLG